MHVGWKIEGKAQENEQQRERAKEGGREEGRKGETYGTYSTQHEMCDGCLSCHERVAHASHFCFAANLTG